VENEFPMVEEIAVLNDHNCCEKLSLSIHRNEKKVTRKKRHLSFQLISRLT